jgi:hypothetical protein
MPGCPIGWSCDVDGVCVYPTGHFTNAPTHADSGKLGFGDLDGDGIPDVFDDNDGNDLLVLFGDRAASFTAQISVPGGGSAGQLAVGDFDLDGRADVVVTRPGEFDVLLGRASRALEPYLYTTEPPLTAQFGQAKVVAVRTDSALRFETPLVVSAVSGAFTLELQDPAAAAPAVTVPVGFAATIDDLAGPIRTADVDPGVGDGDEVIFGFTGHDTVFVYSASIAGGIPQIAPDTIVTAPAPLAGDVLVADTDGDGHLDLILPTDNMGDMRVYVAHGDGTGAFAAPVEDTRFRFMSPPICAADLDGDGVADYVVPTGIALSHGAALDLTVSAPMGLTAEVGDFNHDGFVDVAAGGGSVWLGAPGGAYNELDIPELVNAIPIAIGDFDGDRFDDLAVQGFLPNGNGGFITFLYGAPTHPLEDRIVGSLPLFHFTTSYSRARLASSPGLGDATDDLLLLTGSVGPGSGEMSLTEAIGGAHRPDSPTKIDGLLTVVSGHFVNKNGIDDLAAFANGRVVIFRGPLGALPSADSSKEWIDPSLPAPLDPSCLEPAVGDADSDGYDDVVVIDLCAAQIVFVSMADVLAVPPKVTVMPIPGNALITDPTLADLDGDGAADLILISEPGVTVSWGGPDGPDVAHPTVIDPPAGVDQFLSVKAIRVDPTGALALAMSGESNMDASKDGVYLARSSPDRAFTVDAAPAIRAFVAGTLWVHDVNGDGIDDVLLEDANGLDAFIGTSQR